MSEQRAPEYCCYCGYTLVSQLLPGDNRLRHWCSQCQTVHYQNPTILVAAFLHCGDKLLWTRRGIEPYKGLWAFPAGYAECDESLQQAAARELLEETTIRVKPEKMIPMSISSVLAINQVYMVFRYPCEREFAAELTEETLDWGWFNRREAPWDKMAHIESKALVEQVYTAVESQQFFMRIGQMGQDGNKHQCYALS